MANNSKIFNISTLMPNVSNNMIQDIIITHLPAILKEDTISNISPNLSIDDIKHVVSIVVNKNINIRALQIIIDNARFNQSDVDMIQKNEAMGLFALINATNVEIIDSLN
jgi:predicted flavoprotein YhiN